jgi:hypothetical protein
MVDRKFNYQSISNILGICIAYIGMKFNNRCLFYFEKFVKSIHGVLKFSPKLPF